MVLDMKQLLIFNKLDFFSVIFEDISVDCVIWGSIIWHSTHLARYCSLSLDNYHSNCHTNGGYLYVLLKIQRD